MAVRWFVGLMLFTLVLTMAAVNKDRQPMTHVYAAPLFVIFVGWVALGVGLDSERQRRVRRR